MGMIYTATIEQIAVTVAQDLFTITAPADAVVILHSCYIGQETDEGDAQAEMLPVQITRYGTAGSAGTGLTGRPHDVGYAAHGSTVVRNNTTQGGTPVVILGDCFNVQAGWQYRPTPEERITISPSGVIAIELPVAPADSLTITASLIFEEIGG